MRIRQCHDHVLNRKNANILGGHSPVSTRASTYAKCCYVQAGLPCKDERDSITGTVSTPTRCCIGSPLLACWWVTSWACSVASRGRARSYRDSVLRSSWTPTTWARQRQAHAGARRWLNSPTGLAGSDQTSRAYVRGLSFVAVLLCFLDLEQEHRKLVSIVGQSYEKVIHCLFRMFLPM